MSCLELETKKKMWKGFVGHIRGQTKFFWQTDEMVDRKLKFYRESGQIEDMKHPLEFGGGLEQLPEFLRE